MEKIRPRMPEVKIEDVGVEPHEFQEEFDAIPRDVGIRALREYETSHFPKMADSSSRRAALMSIIWDHLHPRPKAGEATAVETMDLDRYSKASFGARDFMAMEIPRPISIIGDGVLCGHSIGLVGGKTGLGKTWLLLQLARAAVRGEPFFGLSMPLSGIRVGILLLEGHAAYYQDRLRAVLDPPDERDNGLHVVARPTLKGAVDILGAGEVDRLSRWVDSEGLGLLIVDPLKNAHCQEENSNTEMGQVCAAFQEVAYRTGAGVLVSHHESAKGTSDGRERDPLAAFRGAGRLTDDARLLMLMRKHPSQQVVLSFPKASDAVGGEPRPVWLKGRGDGPFELGIDPGSVSDENAGKVLATLERTPGVSAKAIAEATGLTKSTVQRHLQTVGAVANGPQKARIYYPPTQSTQHTPWVAGLALVDNGLANN